MKTDHVSNTTVASNVKGKAMEIEDVGKFFGITIKYLYGNPIQSLIRETWTNAQDAHIAAGCPERPFLVSFPSVFNPVCKVRDYGVSMSPEVIEKVWMKPGNSTKETSNAQTGKWGLGSKSPFAYIDSFTLVTYLDGVKRTYLAEMPSDEEAPDLTEIHECPTDEENGVEVSFPIARADVDKFRAASHRVAYGFDVKPITDDANFEGWNQPSIISQGEDWKLLSGPLEGYTGRAYAKMGPVLYPIDATEIDGLNAEQRKLLNHTVIIEFAMGDLMITPSREALSFKKGTPTADTITKRMATILDEMSEETVNEIESAATLWEATRLYSEVHYNQSIPQIVRTAVAQRARWQGQEITTTIPVDPAGLGMRVCRIENKKLSNRAYRFASNVTTLIAPKTKPVIMLESLDVNQFGYPVQPVNKAASRIREYVHANRGIIDNVIWVKYAPTCRKSMEAMVAFLDRIDGAPLVISVDDLPEPAKAPRAASRPVSVKLLDYRSNFTERTELDDEEMEQGGYYVQIERHDAVWDPRLTTSNVEDLHRLMKSFNQLDAGKYPYLVGVPKAMMKKFTGDQWVNINDLVIEAAAKLVNKDKIVRATAIGRAKYSRLIDFVENNMPLDTLDKKSILVEACEFRLGVAKMPVEDTNQMERLARIARMEVDASPDVSQHDLVLKLEYYERQIKDTYPLMSAISNSYGTERAEMIDNLPDYVQMCDMVSEMKKNQAKAA